MSTSTPTPTFQLVAAASAAREHAMKEAHQFEGTVREVEFDEAFVQADRAYRAACKAHRAARRAHGDNV